MNRILTVAGLLLSTIASLACGPASEPLSPGASGRVVRIIDGDTLDIRLSGSVERVRLIGIDTPETKKPGTPVECYGPEATRRLTELLPPGTEVVVARDVEARDDFGRLLLYVFRFDDQLLVNADLVSGGFARTLDIPPNTTHARDLKRLSAEAESAKIGLWNACSVKP